MIQRALNKKLRDIVKTHPVSSRIWLIGNAPESECIAHLALKGDIIVRFNNPNPDCVLKADILLAANAYENIKSLSVDTDYLNDDCLLIFRYHPLTAIRLYWKTQRKIKIIAYYHKLLRFFRNSKLPIRYCCLPHRFVRKVRTEILKTNKIPSSGFIMLAYLIDQFPDTLVVMHNFTFQGWDGHPWAEEKAFVDRLVGQRKVELV